MKPGSHVVFLVQRIGPYHHARLEAWATQRGGGLTAIEFRPQDTAYAWAPVQMATSYERQTSRPGDDLCARLDRLAPAAIVCTGYADVEVRQAVAWALRRGVPLVTCSDSTYGDQPRRWLREGLKRLVLQPFSAALAAGTRSADYLHGLGLKRGVIFRPWDVVDNGHFARLADETRRDAAERRRALNLPERYFLCVARFIGEKNFPRLIAAYARYVWSVPGEAWSLVLCGSGPLGAELRATVAAAGLQERVHFTGFLQYDELPAIYGLAGALVLPSQSETWGLAVNEAMAAGLPVLVSTHCGCAPDLVQEGQNGFTFDPQDEALLADRMLHLTRLDAAGLGAMGRRSREIIADYSPEAFARGVESAVRHAIGRRDRPASWLARRLNERLAARAVPAS